MEQSKSQKKRLAEQHRAAAQKLIVGAHTDKSTDLEKMEAQGLKRFMVGEVQETVKLSTVYAKDVNDAVKIVLHGEGRAAGFEGPNTIFHLAKEIGLDKNYEQGTFTKAFNQMRLQVMQRQRAEEEKEKKIIVPDIVPPTDLVKP